MKRQHKTLALAALGVALVLALLAAGGYLLDRAQVSGHGGGSGKTVEEMLGLTGQEAAPVFHDGRWYRENPDVASYFLMGIDRAGEPLESGGYNDGGQADLQLLLVADHRRERYTVLQINRDTMTRVDVLGVTGKVVDSRTEQIALAHGYGNGLENSCENAVRALSNLLYGVGIDGYAAIRMDAVPVLNDAIGGVTVMIEDDFSQIAPSLVQGETITLTGQQALDFVRSRYHVDDSSNLSRMRRHRTYLSAFARQLQQQAEQDLELVVTLYDAALPYMVTNIKSGEASRLAEQLRGYENRGVVTIEGEAKVGETFMEFYPDENSLRAVVLDLFYLETEQPDYSAGG